METAFMTQIQASRAEDLRNSTSLVIGDFSLSAFIHRRTHLPSWQRSFGGKY
jgi:hypothetical protein